MIGYQRIIDAAKLGPATVGGLAHRLGVEGNRIASAIGTAINRKSLIPIGTLREAQAAGVKVECGPHKFTVRHDAMVYAIAGTERLPKSVGEIQPPKGRPAGRITIGRGYKWGSRVGGQLA